MGRVRAEHHTLAARAMIAAAKLRSIVRSIPAGAPASPYFQEYTQTPQQITLATRQPTVERYDASRIGRRALRDADTVWRRTKNDAARAIGIVSGSGTIRKNIQSNSVSKTMKSAKVIPSKVQFRAV